MFVDQKTFVVGGAASRQLIEEKEEIFLRPNFD